MIVKISLVALGLLLMHSAAAGKIPDDTPFPQGHIRLEFGAHLKIAQDPQLTGTRDSRSVSFTLPSRWRALPGSSLHLFIRHAEELDGDRSFLSISLNYGILRSLRLDHRNATLTEVVVPIPPEMIKPQNELVFSIEQFRQPTPNGGEIWSSISTQSFLAIHYKEEPPELSLSRLPSPMLEADTFHGNRLAVLLPARFGPSTLEGTARLVANLVKRVASDRVTVRTVRSMRATRDPLLVVGTPEEQPELLSLRGRSPLLFSRSRGETILRSTNGEVFGENEGVVGLATKAEADPTPILFVTANSASGVLLAASHVLGPRWSASGTLVRVTEETRLAAPKVREWHGFIPPRSFFTLADLGLHNLKITSQRDGALVVPLNATPDAHFLDYGNRMVLRLRLNPDLYVGNAHLLVQVNDVSLADIAVRERFSRSIGSLPVAIPMHLLRPRNVLRISWEGPSNSVTQGGVAWLLPTSEFYLPRYYEAELPELGLLRSQLYPFSLKADLSDALVVVPNDLNEEMFSALIELSLGFARLAPAEYLAFRVRRLSDLSRADLSEFHLIFLNLEGRQDRLAALLPNWKPTPRVGSFGGSPTIREMTSPWNPARYVLVISARSGRQLHQAVTDALSESTRGQLRGDFAYLGANRPESFVLGPRRRTADYSYQVFIEAWLRAHWLALPVVLITVSGLLSVGVRLGLHRYRLAQTEPRHSNRRLDMSKTLTSQADGTEGMVVVRLRSPAVTIKAELASAAMRRALFAECFGSLLFVLFGAGTVAVTSGLLGEKLTSARLLTMALAQGIAFVLLVLATVRLSGGHLNPAVTFAAMIIRQMSVTKGTLYVIAQCAGAVAGALVLTLILPSTAQGALGAHMLAGKVSMTGALLTEILLTFVLVSSVLTTTRGAVNPPALGFLVIGLSAIVGYLFGIPITGGSMNPARSFGPALVAGVWKDHWVFWVGPLAGAAVAGLVYEFCFSRDIEN